MGQRRVCDQAPSYCSSSSSSKGAQSLPLSLLSIPNELRLSFATAFIICDGDNPSML